MFSKCVSLICIAYFHNSQSKCKVTVCMWGACILFRSFNREFPADWVYYHPSILRKIKKNTVKDYNVWHSITFVCGTVLVKLTILMKDVFPAPLGPSMPKHYPERTSRYNPLTAIFGGFPSLPGYTFFKLSHKMACPALPSFLNCCTFSLCLLSHFMLISKKHGKAKKMTF